MPCRSFYIRESQFISCINSCIVCLYYSLFNHFRIDVHQLVSPGGEEAVKSNAIMNGFVYVSCTCMSISVGEILKRVIAGSKCICILNFFRFIQIAIPKGSINLHSPMLYESAHFSTVVPTQIIINLCIFRQFKGQKMVCHCFNLHFSDYY